MIDWLEEILKAAEAQWEAETESDLSALSIVSAGIAVRSLQEADAGAETGALLQPARSVLDNGWRQGADVMHIGEDGSVSWTYASEAVRIPGVRSEFPMGGEEAAADGEMVSAGVRYLEQRVNFEQAHTLQTAVAAEREVSGEEYRGMTLLERLMGRISMPQGGVLRSLIQRVGVSEQIGNGVSDLRWPGTDSGLQMLYRRAGEAVRSAIIPGTATSGMTVVQESSGPVAGLTAEELDRAVRRDSRRYDGGMSIY